MGQPLTMNHDDNDDEEGVREDVLSMSHARVCGALHVQQASEQADGWVFDNMLGLRWASLATGHLRMDSLRDISRDNRRLGSCERRSILNGVFGF